MNNFTTLCLLNSCWPQASFWISSLRYILNTLQWRHNERDSVSIHQPHDCFLNRLCRHRSKKTSKLRVTGLCAGNSPEAGEFPTQMASNVENFSIWWRHHATTHLQRDATEVQVGCSVWVTNHLRSCSNSVMPEHFKYKYEVIIDLVPYR